MNSKGIQLTWLGHAAEDLHAAIGVHFTMSPREAAYACRLLEPEMVIPMHFGTFPLLTGRASERQALAPGVKVVELKRGQTIS